ncbi:MAG: DNA translocase FtsK 4TM domain-containing protein, partial [Alsobacter sp.]
MRTTRANRGGFEHVSDIVRDFLWRRAAEIAGLAMLAFSCACGLALVTWSVQDPSLNHAIEGPVRNLLGRPGAIIADILMQMIGVASIALIAPPALAGVRMLGGRALVRTRLRVALWIAGTLAAAAVASSLPPTARWPLPTGLGGVLGDFVFSLFRGVTGQDHGPLRVLVTLGLAILAILGLSAAAGFGFDHAEAEEQEAREKRATRLEDLEDDDTTGEPGLGIVSVGAIFHGLLAIRGSLGRMWRRRAERSRALVPRLKGMVPVRQRQDDPLDALRRTTFDRTEPGFAPVPQRAPAESPPQNFDDEDLPQDDSRRQAPVIEGTAQPRVAPRPPAPKPGKRLSREAQPSLLDEDRYQLPPLALLAEPKKTPVTAVSTEALEQNARLLEGVLEDF